MGLEDKLVRKKLEVLLKETALVEKYLRIFGPKLDMNNINKLKQDQQKASTEGGMGEKDDPTYVIKVKCPVCNQAVYSRAGVHPQCAVRQSEPPRPKGGVPKVSVPDASVAPEIDAV